MKHLLLFLLIICLSNCFLYAQQLSPVVLASNGGSGHAGDVRLEWTLGELAIEHQTGHVRSFTEGFHQPIRLIEQVDMTSADQKRHQVDHQPAGVSLSPNPVSTELLIRFDPTVSGLLTCYILDANGNQHLQKILDTEAGEVQLDLADLGPGLFFIQLISADDGTNSLFKLIKVN